MAQAVGFSRALATVRRTVAARRDAKRRARAVRIPPCSSCIVCRKNKKQHPARCCSWRRRWDSNPRDIAVKLISSLVRTWCFRVCCGRWRQFWKRRKSLCCNGFRTHRPVLTSSISEKTRVQIEMRNAPKRSIFLRAGKKIRKKKTLVRYGFADSHPD